MNEKQKGYCCQSRIRGHLTNRELTKLLPGPAKFAAKQMALHPRGWAMVGDIVVNALAGNDFGTQTVVFYVDLEQKKLQRAGADLIILYPAVIRETLME